ncbi:helix-turn-helix domain-containing protein [Nonlabens agnitus]|uniref:HTH cro/C1-type domain-containing protein n=1 Tax=Nonlabens agnitus TaxID=870484 RepID=A0A2S9WTQ6_9FLAO|nr:helix-turn-helix transcriptional regulator [Nonlabens agnitus]PRP66839.1 hypothetical protein BST86_06845 [Nonlabens agnitus]
MLFTRIFEMIPKGSSLNEEIATVLGISYDAAHRRISGKSKLSLDEALQLSAHYGLSLDALQENAAQNIVAVHKTQSISSVNDLQQYFETSTQYIQQIAATGDSRLFYAAKDIPLFHFMDGSALCRFKIYVWMRLLSTEFDHTPFDKFHLSIDLSNAIKNLGKLYDQIPKAEIWDTTTFNSTLKQIQFYLDAELMNADKALQLCDELEHVLQESKSKVTSLNNDYQLYHNELLLMNNTVLIKNKHQMGFFIPFTFLSYLLATDINTCQQAEAYLNKQLSHSRLINTAGERSRNIFFSKISKKIDSLKALITARNVLDFE